MNAKVLIIDLQTISEKFNQGLIIVDRFQEESIALIAIGSMDSPCAVRFLTDFEYEFGTLYRVLKDCSAFKNEILSQLLCKSKMIPAKNMYERYNKDYFKKRFRTNHSRLV